MKSVYTTQVKSYQNSLIQATWPIPQIWEIIKDIQVQ